MTKRASKGKHIVAQSITLKDTKGKTRIAMTAWENCADISLFGEQGRTISLMAAPDGGLHLSFRDDDHGKLAAGMAITAENRMALYLYDHRTGSRTELGTTDAEGAHQLTLIHGGKLVWTTSPSGGKIKKPSAAKGKTKL